MPKTIYYDERTDPAGYLPPFDLRQFGEDGAGDWASQKRKRLEFFEDSDDWGSAAYIVAFPPDTFDAEKLVDEQPPGVSRLQRFITIDDDDAIDPSVFTVFVWTDDLVDYQLDDEPTAGDFNRSGVPRRMNAAANEDDGGMHFADLFGTYDSGGGDYTEQPDGRVVSSRLRSWLAVPNEDPDGIEPSTFVVIIADAAEDNDFGERLAATQRMLRARIAALSSTVAGEEQTPWWEPANGDSIRVWLTGAASDGAAQADQAASLGNYRSSTELVRVGTRVLKAISGVQISFASRANLPETAGAMPDQTFAGNFIAQNADWVKYSAAGSATFGPAVKLAVGQIDLLYDGEDPSKWLRVTRTSSASLLGVGQASFVDVFNTAIAMTDAAEAESAAGGHRYRWVMLSNVALATVRDIRIWIPELATASTAAGGALAGAGAGTITGPADGFVDWPATGWARIESSTGTLREIAYYSSRTDSALTVPAAGRGRLGTSAAAGSTSDVVRCVPGVRIATELASPRYKGPVQTIASESTSPVSVAWSTACDATTGLAPGDLASYENLGIAVDRDLSAGVAASARMLSAIKFSYTVEGQEYTETLAGLYRIADNDLRRHELFVGVNALPSLAGTPDATRNVAVGTDAQTYLAANPWTPAYSFAPGATYYLLLQFRNEYGLATQSLQAEVWTIDGSGDLQPNPPSAPDEVTIEAAAGGTFTIRAVYYYDRDTDVDETDATLAAARQADTWLIYFTSDGSTPNPAGATTATATMVKQSGSAVLTYTTGAFAGGTVGKVIVRTRRSDDTADSSNVDVHQATAVATGPSAPEGWVFWDGNARGN